MTRTIKETTRQKVYATLLILMGLWLWILAPLQDGLNSLAFAVLGSISFFAGMYYADKLMRGDRKGVKK